MSENTDNRIITLSSYPRAIVHIDCDAFFTSCEQAKNPALKGLPIITGKERGIVACASYEAKALGIQRGAQLSKVKKLHPEIILLPNDYETYSLYSERMFSIIRCFTPTIEEFSIDEAFCDIAGLRRIYRTSYPEIAKKIKRKIQKELDITVSVGLSLSKTLAKICSRYKKPDGFTALPGYRLHAFLNHIPLGMVCGFGVNTVELLQKHGVKNVLEYAQKPVSFAERLLGKVGVELWRELRGEAVYGLIDEKKEKYLSISKSKTFSPSSENKEFVKSHLMRNLEAACIKLRRHGLSARNLAAYIKTSGFDLYGLEARLTRHSNGTLDFTHTCSRLFKLLFKKRVSYRATGIILSDIVPEGIDSRTLFDDPARIEKISKISKTIDEISKRYGKYAVHVASSNEAIAKKEKHSRNDIAWRKKELLKGESFRKRLNIPLYQLHQNGYKHH
jgi:DNA polymerase-4/DNA polymerase V